MTSSPDLRLASSDPLYRTMIENSLNGIVVFDRAERVVMCNEAMCRLVGYREDELVGHDPRIYRHPDEDEAIEARVRARLDGEDPPRQYRRRLVRKDGELVEVESSVSLIKVDDTIIGMIVSHRDVTAERRSRRALEESEAHLARAQRLAHVGSWQWNPSSNDFRMTDEVYRIAGLDQTDAPITLNDAVALIHPDDREMIEKATSAASTPGSRYEGYSRLVRADGSERTVHQRIEAVRDEDGEVLYVTGTTQDITDRVESEGALQESERRYRALIETAQSGIAVINEAGYADVLNPALCKILGYESDELVGMNLFQVIHPDDREEIAERFGARLAGDEKPLEYRIRLLHKDGHTVDVEIAASMLVVGGRTFGALVEVRDISEQLRLREQLLQSQKSEALGTLVAGVAHDFNNLLMAIGGSIEIAKDDSDPSQWLERATVATDRATQLVAQLLQFARRQPPRPTIVDLGRLVAETVDLLRETTDRRVTFEVAPSATVRVWADAGQMHQVLMNLLVNARDAVLERLTATEGTDAAFQPRISVMLSGSSALRHELTVSDNGAGMTDEVRERIFDPFFTTKEVGEGTGLGMSTVFAIVNDHGGSISVESAPGQGTIVRVQLRAAIKGVAEADEPAEPAGAPQPNGVGSILVVDDEPTICEWTEYLLRRAGFDVVAVCSGEEALLELKQRAYDLLLVDVNMPTPNGWRVLHQALTLNPEQRIVMSSGYALEEEARERGAGGLLRKPFNGPQLLETVNAVLGIRATVEPIE